MEGRALASGRCQQASYFLFMHSCGLVQLQGRLSVLPVVSCMERVLSYTMMKRRKTACSVAYQSIYSIPVYSILQPAYFFRHYALFFASEYTFP